MRKAVIIFKYFLALLSMQQEKPATPPSHHPRPPKIRKDLFCFDSKFIFLLLRNLCRSALELTKINFYIKRKFCEWNHRRLLAYKKTTRKQRDCSDSKTQLKSNETRASSRNTFHLKLIIGNTLARDAIIADASCDGSEEVEWRRGEAYGCFVCFNMQRVWTTSIRSQGSAHPTERKDCFVLKIITYAIDNATRLAAIGLHMQLR